MITIRPSKLEDMATRLDNRVDFEVLHGVVGADLSERELAEANIYRPQNFYKMTRGEIGCFLSHKTAWEAVATGLDDWVLILEDDANVNPDTIEKFQAAVDFLAQRDPNWGVLVFGYKKLDQLRPAPPALGGSFLLPSAGFGLHCYALSRRGAAALNKGCFPIPEPVDTYVFRKKARLYASKTPILAFEGISDVGVSEQF